MLHAGDLTRGAGALVRMGSTPEAAAAIDGLNNLNIGSTAPLLVRYDLPTADCIVWYLVKCTACWQCEARRAGVHG